MKKTLLSIMTFLSTATFLAAAPQAVIFDWGYVIGFHDRSVIVNFICDSFNLSESEFEAANLEKRQAVEAGKTDIDFWLDFANRKGIHLPQDWPEKYTAALKDSLGVDPNMYVLVEQLKANGIQVGMLSNIDDHYKELIGGFGFYEPFDPCLLSCEIGLLKPDPQVYKLLLETIKLPPQDIVFVDDKLENIEAAKAMGIDAILFESEPQLRIELRKREAIAVQGEARTVVTSTTASRGIFPS